MIRHVQNNAFDKQSAAGFSLIELAIIMTIAGLMVASALSTFDAYTKRKAFNTTEERINNIQLSFGRFVAEYGRLPCPADPTLPATHADAGKENCRPGGLVYPTLSPDGCNGHCRIQGARQQFGNLDSSAYPTNGVPVAPGLEHDRVLRGVVPYKTLGLALREGYDGWGTMMTYAVTELLSSSYLVSNDESPPWGTINYEKRYGAISIRVWDAEDEVDENVPYTYEITIDEDTGEATPVGALDSWPFVLLSHGPDTKGGWTVGGTQAVPCTGQGRDIRNCDPESASFVTPEHIVTVRGDRFYDDAAVMTDYVVISDKWFYSGIKTIQSRQSYIGINNEDPLYPLDVTGDMKVGKARANRYCNAEGENCFNPGIIGGSTGIRCNGGAMRGIQNNDAACDASINLGSITVGRCSPGSFLVGFCPDGSKMCRPFGGAQPTCD